MNMSFLIDAAGGKLPEWISATAATVSMFGVLLVWKQLTLTQRIAQLQFEDSLEREYRELVTQVPTKAMLDSDLTEEEFRKTFDEFFRYFDLTNRQIVLRNGRRIGDATWADWVAGIRFNMALPAFQRAWGEIKSRTEDHASEFFSELRELEKSRYLADPRNWQKK